MSPSGQSKAARARRVSYPLLMECNPEGQILWMSDRAREVLGSPATLLSTFPRWRPAGTSAEVPSELVYTRLMELGGTVLIGARPVEAAEIPADDVEIALLRLQARLFLHYSRLLTAEQSLSRRAGRSRGASGIRALRQIELERERLGRELHTGVGQQLSAIRLQAEVIASQLPLGSSLAQEALDRISTLTADALEQVRSISKRLHPPEWQRLSLEAAVQQLWELSGIPQKFEGTLRVGALSREPSLDSKIFLYRAAQEAVSNLIRHSRATRVELELAEHEGRLVLTFRDNGVGFDAERVFAAPASVSGGIGLRSIRDQAANLGGKLAVESGPSGTKLEITVPFIAEVA